MSRTLIDISIFLNVLGFGQGLFLCFILWKSKNVKPENIYLIFLLLAMCIIILNAILRLSYYVDVLWFFEIFSNSFLLIIAPSIFLFIRAKTGNAPLKITPWNHYLPFMLYFIFVLTSFILSKSEHPISKAVGIIAYLTFNIQFLVYLGLSLVKLNRLTPLPNTLKWTRIAVWLIIVPWLLQLGFLFGEKLFGIFTSDFFSLNLSLLFGECAILLSYAHSSGNVGFAKKDKYEDSRISPLQLAQNLDLIKSIITDERLFLDKDLSLAKISEKTQLPPRTISLTLNQMANQNFVDFINSYRIECFKESIRQESSNNYTIVAIAENCGFKSSSVFYAAFRKQTGITPRQYKDNLS